MENNGCVQEKPKKRKVHIFVTSTAVRNPPTFKQKSEFNLRTFKTTTPAIRSEKFFFSDVHRRMAVIIVLMLQVQKLTIHGNKFLTDVLQ